MIRRSNALNRLREKAADIWETTICLVFLGVFIALLGLMAKAMQPVLGPPITLFLAAAIIVYAARAGWFTAIMVYTGIAVYLGSFVVAPALGAQIATAICGIGVVLVLLAWIRSLTPPQQRCLVAA